jgi:SAM-dependent methyltransferase
MESGKIEVILERYYDKQTGRLLCIGRKADKDMWEERWHKENIVDMYSSYRISSTDNVVIDVTHKYLPRRSVILEGGCGLGYYVYLLGLSGFNVVGVDYAKNTIRDVKTVAPSLSLCCCDLENLPFGNNVFDGYWSFGVIEHFSGGYNKISKEMIRVLKPGGILFVTVPIVSKLRNLKAKLGLYKLFDKNTVDMSCFYQYVLPSEDVISEMESVGFRLLEVIGWNAYAGITEEVPWLKILIGALYKTIGKISEIVLRNGCNHMNIFVFQKAE